MASAMTLTTKSSSSLVNSSKHSSPIINQIESYSPSSSSTTTLSPQSSNSISSPDKSFTILNDQSIRLIDYFVVSGLDKSIDVEPSIDLITNEPNFKSI